MLTTSYINTDNMVLSNHDHHSEIYNTTKLDGVKYLCIINVETSAVFKVSILQCITVDLLFGQISALLFSILYCNFINTLYK
jgi:hypothetical protein